MTFAFWSQPSLALLDFAGSCSLASVDARHDFAVGPLLPRGALESQGAYSDERTCTAYAPGAVAQPFLGNCPRTAPSCLDTSWSSCRCMLSRVPRGMRGRYDTVMQCHGDGVRGQDGALLYDDAMLCYYHKPRLRLQVDSMLRWRDCTKHQWNQCTKAWLYADTTMH